MPELFLIKDVKVRRVDRTPVFINHYSPPVFAAYDGKESVPVNDVLTEQVVIRTYRKMEKDKTRPTEIHVGMPKKVQKLLGLQYEAFEEVQNERDVYYNKCNSLKWDNTKLKECVTNLENKVDRFQNMSFWQRLKFLIFGRKVFKNATQ